MEYQFSFQRLKDVREDHELTQKNMAEILKTSQSNYSRWEKNTKIIPLIKLNDFCNYFKISMDYVSGLTNEKKAIDSNITLNKKIVANRLKEVRKENNLTQMDLAHILNTTQSTISAYEKGETLILTVFAIDICKRFDISLDWLCGRK